VIPHAIRAPKGPTALSVLVVIFGLVACASGDGREMEGLNPSDTAGVVVTKRSTLTTTNTEIPDRPLTKAAPKILVSQMSGQIGTLAEYNLDYPQIAGSDLESAINGAIEAEVASAYSSFRAAVLEEERIGVGGNILRGKGKVVFVDSRLLSVVFDFISEWADSVAVQKNTSTLLIDLETGIVIEPDEIFLREIPWLEKIGFMVRSDLEAQFGAETLFMEGLDPLMQNFRHVAITSEGLILRFDQYQVAPGVAGTPWVDLPWSSVHALIDPMGSIGYLLP